MRGIIIPEDVAAKVLFLSDRTCCVCRKPGKPCQIHHIDEKKNNHIISNLGVLCLDCHNETQIKGGFHRKLSAEQIILYRDDWYNLVLQRRSSQDFNKESPNQSLKFKRLSTAIEVYHTNKDYTNLAMMYNIIGNAPLRDKYIELAIATNPEPSTLLFLRSLQERVDLVPQEIKQKIIDEQIRNKDYSQLARTYHSIGNYKKAAEYYCKSIIEDIEKGNLFSAAYYLKELCEEELFVNMFEEDLKQRIKGKDLYWQIRCLEELGWYDEIQTILIKNQKIIESAKGKPLKYLREKLYSYLKNEDKYLEEVKRISEEEAEINTKKPKK